MHCKQPFLSQKEARGKPKWVLLSPTVLYLFPERLVHTAAMNVRKQAQCVYQTVHHPCGRHFQAVYARWLTKWCNGRYPDYVLTDSGLQYKDLRDGPGDAVSNGAHVTVDWDGYTLGYYGRPFEARNTVNVRLCFIQRRAALSVMVSPNSVSPMSSQSKMAVMDSVLLP